MFNRKLAAGAIAALAIAGAGIGTAQADPMWGHRHHRHHAGVGIWAPALAFGAAAAIASRPYYADNYYGSYGYAPYSYGYTTSYRYAEPVDSYAMVVEEPTVTVAAPTHRYRAYSRGYSRADRNVRDAEMRDQFYN